MWERRNGGYLIVADEMVEVAIDSTSEPTARRPSAPGAESTFRPASAASPAAG